jgi:hypothetical protein
MGIIPYAEYRQRFPVAIKGNLPVIILAITFEAEERKNCETILIIRSIFQ